MPTKQLSLDIQLPNETTFANYYAGDNSALLTHAHRMSCGRGEHYLYLWGIDGVGCTHILHACCHESARLGLRALYLSLADYQQLSASLFEGLESLNLVCVDDIYCIMGQADWEEAFFHFFNHMLTEKKRLIIGSHMAPSGLACRLPDLGSRLSSGLIFQVQPLSDEQKLKALILRAKNKGLILPYASARFLLRHYLRDMPSLVTALDRLDIMSLEAKRRLTIPFIKEVLLA